VNLEAPLNRGSVNSTHIHGTHVPVEEPSTASEPDIEESLDQLVSDLLNVQRHFEAERSGNLEIDQ
jgi:hypothetical protein